MSELKLGTVVSINDQPYVITFTQHIKVARSGATLRTKLKNLLTGSTLERSFSGGDKVEEADIVRRRANYLYGDATTRFFMDNENFEQYELPVETMGDSVQYLTDGLTCDVVLYNGQHRAAQKDHLESDHRTSGGARRYIGSCYQSSDARNRLRAARTTLHQRE